MYAKLLCDPRLAGWEGVAKPPGDFVAGADSAPALRSFVASSMLLKSSHVSLYLKERSNLSVSVSVRIGTCSGPRQGAAFEQGARRNVCEGRHRET